MLTYSFEDRGNETLYEYLYRKIRADIMSGVLKQGEALPSKRSFARNLNISTITVENTYAQLQMEGYIYALPRKGFFVSDLSDAASYIRHSRTEQPESSNDSISQTERLMSFRAGVRQGERPVSFNIAAVPQHDPARKRWHVDFSSNQTQPDSFPFSNWAKLSREVLSEEKELLMQNPPTQGTAQLREAIAEHLKAFRGLEVDSDRIVVGAGTEYLYGLLIQLLGTDKVYACENPGYRKVSQVFSSFRVRFRLIPIDEEGLDARELARQETHVVHVTPSHHFPTGITMPVNRRYELLNWAAQGEDRYLIEDDYDSELRMSGRPMPALFSMDTEGRVIYMNTFTKTLASTIRVSYMILPEDLMDRFRKEMGFYSCSVSTFEQYTLARFIGQGYFEKHLNRMRNFGRKKRDLILDRIADSPMGEITRIFEEHAGLHFLMNIALNRPVREFLAELEAVGIRLIPLSRYYIEPAVDEEDGIQLIPPGRYSMEPSSDEGDCVNKPAQERRLPIWLIGDKNPEHTFVVNYSSVPVEQITEAVKIISEAALRSS